MGQPPLELTALAAYFFYGTLCHAPLLRVVLGREVKMSPARLPGHHVVWAQEGPFPLLVEGGAGAEGVYVPELAAGDLARLAYYEAGFAFDTRETGVETPSGLAPALVFIPRDGAWRRGAPWRLQDWAGRWGAVVTETARDVMALYGKVPAERVLARYRMMLVRAAARLRARAEAGPATLRRAAAPGDVAVRGWEQVYANFFAVEEIELSHRRFDGAMSPALNRAVFVTGDAAVLLPYDPVRDRVLLIEQFRAVALGRGDPEPWMLEAVAGRVDGGESPEEAARREAVEEAGIDIRRIEPAVNYYPSPGTVAEFIYSYIGIADLPDGCTGTAGLETEDEDIRSHLLPFDRLMELVETGEVNSAPLVLLAYWLARNRDRLRASAGGGT